MYDTQKFEKINDSMFKPTVKGMKRSWILQWTQAWASMARANVNLRWVRLSVALGQCAALCEVLRYQISNL